MPYALVQEAAVAGTIFSDNSEVLAFPGSVAAGNLVVVVIGVGNNNRTVSSVTASNITFSLADSLSSTSPTALTAIYYGVATGAFTDVTVTLSGDPSASAGIKLYEFSGNAADSTPVTNKNNLPAQASPCTSASVTPATADNVVIAAIWSSTLSGTASDSAFTHHWFEGSGTASFRGVGYAIQSAATSQAWDGEYASGAENLLFTLAAFPGADTASATPILMAHYQ